jgi:hypothetical protein
VGPADDHQVHLLKLHRPVFGCSASLTDPAKHDPTTGAL